jgi:intracellular sulfur oxidation DsrE/DsrF family protein
MVKLTVFLVLFLPALAAMGAEGPKWPAPVAPAVPEADGYVTIPNAAVPPSKDHVYKAIFDATQGADKPGHILPALNMLGSELNALAASGVPAKNVRFVVVFHGAAINGILKDEAYKAKFGVSNPNLPVLRRMKAQGVELFVCGQNLAFDGTDPGSLTPDVAVASDALIVSMTYQNNGYAVLSF